MAAADDQGSKLPQLQQSLGGALYFNNFVSGPASPGNYVQPGQGNPSPNSSIANFPVGRNPLGIEEVGDFNQPGSAAYGYYDPNSVKLACPIDSTPMQVVGSHDFDFRCPGCGRQFRYDGVQLQPSVFFPAPLIVPANPAFLGSQWPDNTLPAVDLSSTD
jgi:hypothetical protein